jgi:hypothetical protein
MRVDDGNAFYSDFESLRGRLMEEDASRFGDVASQMPTPSGRCTELDVLVLGEGELRYFDGDVHVRGDLTAGEEGAMVVVAGDLRVDGAIHAHAWYSLILCRGVLSASSIRTKGEIAALGGIEVAQFYWGYYNDHSTIAPRIQGPLYISDDRFDMIDDDGTQEQFTNIAAAKTALARVGCGDEDVANLLRIASS